MKGYVLTQCFFNQPTKAPKRLLNLAAVFLDGAGTTFDLYSISPAKSFSDAYKEHGIRLTDEEARGPMGMGKIEHIRTLNKKLEINMDPEILYASYLKHQKNIIHHYAIPVPYLSETIQQLKQEFNLKVALNTAYSKVEASICLDRLKTEFGIEFDLVATSSHIKKNRPHPDLLYYLQNKLNISHRAAVVLGDTRFDALAAHNGGFSFIGVVGTSSMMNVSSIEEANALTPDELNKRHQNAKEEFIAHHAFCTINYLNELPAALIKLDQHLEAEKKIYFPMR